MIAAAGAGEYRAGSPERAGAMTPGRRAGMGLIRGGAVRGGGSGRRGGITRWRAGVVCVLTLFGPGRHAAALSRGSTGADFLKVASGVRAVGMGSGYAAVGEDIYSVYWNPAGIANLQSPETAWSYVNLFHSDHFGGVSLISGALAVPRFPFRAGSLAAGFMALTTGPSDSTDPQALVHAAAGSGADLLAFLTWGTPLTDRVAAGGSLKFVRRSLAGADAGSFVVDPATGESIPTRSVIYSAGGLGADLGCIWENPGRTFSLGGSVQNMGKIGAFGSGLGMNLGSGSQWLPVTFRLGSAVRTRLWGQSLLTTADLTSLIDSIGAPKLSLGVEYGIAGIVFFRIGWEQPLDQPFGRTALDPGRDTGLAALPSPLRGGVGFRWRPGRTTMLQLDYALAPSGTLGSVQHLALLVRWSIPGRPATVAAGASAAADRKAALGAMVIQPKSLTFTDPPKHWKVEITDVAGRVVRTFQGAGMPPKTLAWDGLDERGRVIVNARGMKLKMKLKVRDVMDREVGSEQEIVPVFATPSLMASVGTPEYPAVVFSLPRKPYRTWQIAVQDGDRPVRTWRGEGTPEHPLTWDGRNDDGRPVSIVNPRYTWRCVDADGKTVSGEQPLPDLEADISPESAGYSVRLIGCRYEGEQTAITEDHRVSLQKAARFIAQHPKCEIVIEGYSTGADGDEDNYALAKARAEIVLHALVEEHHLTASRVALRVYGRSRTPPYHRGLSDAEQGQRVDLVVAVRP